MDGVAEPSYDNAEKALCTPRRAGDKVCGNCWNGTDQNSRIKKRRCWNGSRTGARSGAQLEILVAHDLLTAVADASVSISDEAMRGLIALRAAGKFPEGSVVKTAAERQRLSCIFDEVLDKLIEGLLSNPSRRWIMVQLHPALLAVTFESLETREHCRVLVEKILAVLGLGELDGMLNFYLGGDSR
jgi:hypothetical protein